MINHLWIIMDWNRRWAKAKLLPSFAWHKAWADNIKKIVELADEKWIKYLTLWALSVDNLKNRSKVELNWIIKIINSIESFLWEMLEKNVRFKTIWDIEKLPQKTVNILSSIEDKTKNNKWITLTFALVYWWQDEIIRATKKIIKSWLDPEKLTDKEFRKYLDTSSLPIPDMIVRTWWNKRHSGFLLFDSEYSEYYFTDKYWPDFWEEDLDKVITLFSETKRNFGK